MLAKVVHGGPRMAVYFLVHLHLGVPAVPGSQGAGWSQHVPAHDIESYICRCASTASTPTRSSSVALDAQTISVLAWCLC